MTQAAPDLIAVDIGNSRFKLGRFPRSAPVDGKLPEPAATFDLAIAHASGGFALAQLSTWCEAHLDDRADWLVGSVHRAAAERLTSAVRELSERSNRSWTLRQLTYRDLPLSVQVDAPERTGIDRLLAAVAANRIRPPERAAIVVDAGTAITVDLLDARGAFCGGAILPGIAMAARALAEQTDALPRVPADQLESPPAPLGKSTIPAIESGLYWGAVGAIRELVRRLSASLTAPPVVILTSGASPQVAEILAASEDWTVRHEPHLVLAGIALVGGLRAES
jgi:type III pantothenate kinase